MPPQFPLQEVTDLALAGKVGFSRRAERDYQQLGFSNPQAKEVIAWITADEYDGAVSYDTGDWDVYLCPRKCPCDGMTRRLYLKLRIPPQMTVAQVYVTSFHI